MRFKRFDLLSDTHNKHASYKLPGGDFLLHSGDALSRGSYEEAVDFLDWYGDQDYAYRIFVPGNHDWVFEKNPELMAEECKKRGIILLNDSGIEIDGIKFWGSPVQPWFYDWAFNRQRGHEIRKHWDLIPTNTDVLITHGPPKGILDLAPRGGNVGCLDLLLALNKTDVKLHVFGHIHASRGHMNVGDKLFVNAASLNERYQEISGVPYRLTRLDNGLFIVRGKR
jgi:Icc-related predicted phosphoesterase